MNFLPLARNTDLVIQELGTELLVYDLKTHQAYQLNETSMIVFNACDGVTTFDELKEKHQLTDGIIYLALDGLKKENLIAASYVSPFAGLSRSEVIKKVGLASMIALPLIAQIVAPTAAAAASFAARSRAQGQTCNMTRTAPITVPPATASPARRSAAGAVCRD